MRIAQCRQPSRRQQYHRFAPTLLQATLEDRCLLAALIVVSAPTCTYSGAAGYAHEGVLASPDTFAWGFAGTVDAANSGVTPPPGTTLYYSGSFSMGGDLTVQVVPSPGDPPDAPVIMQVGTGAASGGDPTQICWDNDPMSGSNSPGGSTVYLGVGGMGPADFNLTGGVPPQSPMGYIPPPKVTHILYGTGSDALIHGIIGDTFAFPMIASGDSQTWINKTGDGGMVYANLEVDISLLPTPTYLSAPVGTGNFRDRANHLTTTLTVPGGSPLAGCQITFSLGGTTMGITTLGTAITNNDGVATLTGVNLSGYQAGTYPLVVQFAGGDIYTASSAQGTLTIGPAKATMILSEHPVFQRKLNQYGKPVGKSSLTGFMLDFNSALNPATATNTGNYQLATVTTKKVKKVVQHVLHPVQCTVAYTPGSHTVMLSLVGTQAFPTGGQLKISGVTSMNGGVLRGSTVFAIAKNGKSIGPM